MTDASTAPHRLFRAESLRARQLAWQGRPAIALGVPAAFTSISSVALAAAIVADHFGWLFPPCGYGRHGPSQHWRHRGIRAVGGSDRDARGQGRRRRAEG